MSLKLEMARAPRWVLWSGSCLVALGLFIWQFPASWVLSSVGEKTQCKIHVESPSGTLWQGSAFLGFSEPSLNGKSCRPALAVTERLSWKMSCQLLNAGCTLIIDTNALSKPMYIQLRIGEVRIQDNEARLPAEILEVLGAPWTLLHPKAQLHARWSDLTLKENGASGNIRISMNNLISPISQIRPLGSYDVQAELQGDGVNYMLRTSKGPLLLQAQGTFGPQGASGQGDANATPEMKEALTGLLNLIGKRQGDTYKLVF